MNQSNLIEVLAKKYNIDVSTDIKVMELFNKLCTSVDNQETIELLKVDLVSNNEWGENKVAELDVVIAALSDILLELLTCKMSWVVRRKIKKITDKHGIGVQYNEKGAASLTTPNYKSKL